MGEPFLAEVKIISWNYPPKGWAYCNGQLLPINQNQALFSLLGTTYGGNGTTTFALPNLQGSTPIGTGTGAGLAAVNLGQVGGEAAHTLTVAEMPSHNHTPYGASDLANGSTASGAMLATTQTPTYTQQTSNLSPLAGGSVVTNGSGQAHDNMQPYLALNFIICLSGIYPSRA